MGFAFGIYAYTETRSVRKLLFYADPTTAQIVKAGENARLTVAYNEKPLTEDVFAAQLVIWNSGNLPIKPEHIRAPITIRTVPPTQILLEPRFRRITRPEITRPSIDDSQAGKGELIIKWDILEEQDGFAFQVMFVGSAVTRFAIDGAIEGQKHIGTLSFERHDWFITIVIYLLIAVAAVFVILVIISLVMLGLRGKDAKPPRIFHLTYRGCMITLICLVTGLIVRLSYLSIVGPSLSQQNWYRRLWQNNFTVNAVKSGCSYQLQNDCTGNHQHASLQAPAGWDLLPRVVLCGP